MKKKRFSIWKVLLLIVLIIVIALSAGVYFIYRKVNNISEYADKFAYDYQTQIAEHPGDSFKDHIFYDKEKMIFEYKVPAFYLYEVINEDSMSKLLGLPEGLRVNKVGIDLDLEKQNADIYNWIILSDKNGKDLTNTCLLISGDLVLSEDKKEVRLLYDDFYLINDEVTNYASDYVALEKGSVLFTHRFPRDVVYYRMPDYRPDFISDTAFDGEYIYAKYDIAGAMKDYLATTEYNEDPFDVCMEKVWLEVRMNNIAH